MTDQILNESEIQVKTSSELKLVVSRPDLVSLIGKIQSTVPSKPTIPILSNILIEAADNLITITATDLTVSMKVYAEAKVEKEGAITLPARRFFQLIRELTTQQIEIETENEIIHIRSGEAHFRLNGIGKDEFPNLPDLQGGDFFTMSSMRLKDLLSKTAFAAAKDDSRHVLNGIYMSVDQTSLTFIGTDGKRLSKVNAELPSCQLSGQFIVPLKAVDEVIKILDEDHPVKIFFYEDKIAIETHVITIISKLLTGEYPDVSRVIPENSDITVHLHREELIVLLKQIALFTSETNHSVKFSFSNGNLELSAKGSDVGEGKVSMPVDYTGELFEIAFNPVFFMDILRHCKEETVSFGMTDAFNPGMITDQSSALFVIMPMRLQSM